KMRDKKLLSNMPVPSRGICVGVRDSSAPFLKFLDRNHIALGREIQILEKEPYDHSMHVRIGEHNLRISHQIASNLFVKPNAE
ncbi:MAG: FeoA family protein, partial [Robiginitalea sp.]